MNKYKRFPNSELIKDWGKLLTLRREEVIALQEEWDTIHEENTVLNEKYYNEREEKIEEVAKLLKSQGIEVHKYKKKGAFKERNGYLAWFENKVVEPITKNYPYYNFSIPVVFHEEQVVNGVTLYNSVSPSNIIDLYDRIKWQYDKEIEKRDNEDKLLKKSIEYASKYGINIDNLSSKEIKEKVGKLAKVKYAEDNIPDGTEIYLKHECDYCDTYIAGETRCSCGNRRIAITVEGNLIDGFYYYPEGW